MSTDFLVRAATAADIGPLYELHKRSVYESCRDHYSRAQLEAVMTSRTPEMYLPAIAEDRLLLAQDAAGILGFVEAASGEIVKLFIDPGASGRGVGRVLMERGLAVARSGGDGTVRVEATLNAWRFYERLGFRTVDHGFWSHGNDEVPPIEVVVMELGGRKGTE